MELEKAVELFLGKYTNKLTRRAHNGVLQQLMRHIGAGRDVDQIKPFHLEEYIQILESEERGLKPATQQKHIKTIKSFFIWLHQMEITSSNKAARLRQKRIAPDITRDKSMSDTELAALLDYLKYKPRNNAIVRFLADTGCRAGGVATLRFARSEPPEPGLYLADNLAIVTEKFGKTRPVAFGDTTKQALSDWLLERQLCDHDYIFTSGTRPMSPAAISQIIRRACKKIGVRSLGAHSLRHRKGHQLADARVPVTVAAEVLGHSDPAITMGFYYPRDWTRVKSAMSELFLSDDSDTGQNASDKILHMR